MTRPGSRSSGPPTAMAAGRGLYSDTGLAAGRTRNCRVRAVNGGGTGEGSGPARATTERRALTAGFEQAPAEHEGPDSRKRQTCRTNTGCTHLIRTRNPSPNGDRHASLVTKNTWVSHQGVSTKTTYVAGGILRRYQAAPLSPAIVTSGALRRWLPQRKALAICHRHRRQAKSESASEPAMAMTVAPSPSLGTGSGRDCEQQSRADDRAGRGAGACAKCEELERVNALLDARIRKMLRELSTLPPPDVRDIFTFAALGEASRSS